MYVDLDARYTVTHNKANKLDKELTGLHKMYNGAYCIVFNRGNPKGCQLQH